MGQLANVNRRRFTATVGSIIGLSGCLSSPGVAQLGRITISNNTPSIVSFKIKIVSGEREIYKQTHEIEGNNENNIRVPSVVIEEELPEEPQQYKVNYGFPEGTLKEFDFTKSVSDGCGQIIIDIREDKVVNLYVSDDCDGLKYD